MRSCLFTLILAALMFVTSGCSFVARLTSESAGPPSLSLGVTGSEDQVSDHVLKGSLQPILSWAAIPDTTQYKVSILGSDGLTVLCPEVTTSSSTQSFATCTLPDKGSYKAHIVPLREGVWQDILGLVDFTVDGLGLLPRSAEILTGETLQLTADNGQAPYTYGDDGAGLVNTSTGLVTIPLSTIPGTLNLSITDAMGSTNASSLKVRGFADVVGYPFVAPQQGDYSYVTDLLQTPSGALIASVDTLDLPWMENWATYRSTDRGATWTQVDHNQGAYDGETYPVRMLRAGNGDILICGWEWDYINGSYAVIRRSQDDGLTWSDLLRNYGSGGEECRTMELSPTTQTLVAGMTLNGTAGIYRSLNNGATWTLQQSLSGSTWHLTETVAANGDFYVLDGGGPTFYKSTDDGVTWTPLGALPANFSASSIGILADNTTLVLAGARNQQISNLISDHWSIQRSTDGGSTWTETDFIAAGPTPQYTGWAEDLRIDNTGTLWVGGKLQKMSYNSPFWDTLSQEPLLRKSTDGGVTWSDSLHTISSDYSARITRSIRLDNGDMITASFDQGPSGKGDEVGRLYRSTDGGSSWSDLSQLMYTQVFYNEPSAFVADASGRMLMTGYTYDERDSYNHAIVRASLDNGVTWTAGIDVVDPARNAEGSVAAIDSSGSFFAAVTESTWGFTVASAVVIKKSSDGVNWSDLNTWTIPSGQSFTVTGMIVLPDGSLRMTGSLHNTSTNQDDGFVRAISTAGVETMMTLIPPADGSSQQFFHTHIARASDGTLWASATELVTPTNTFWIVQKSIDDGATWTTVDSYQDVAGSAVHADRIAFDAGGAVYVAGESANHVLLIRKSVNGGATWTSVAASSTITNFGTFSDFIIDTDGRLLIATSRGTDYDTTDGGSVWHILADGSAIDVDHFDRPRFYESELQFLSRCGPSSVCAAGVANSSLDEGRRFFVRKLSP